MKLAILCGSLEPGKDGVGDYIRRLAGELQNLGVKVKIFSINDSWVTADYTDNSKSEVRLANNQSWSTRIQKLREFLTLFDPELVSLQFVPYAFHRRGFCFELVRNLAAISGLYKWHIMFHELWLGLDRKDSIKFKITGWFQRHFTLQLVRLLNPLSVHTQSTAYAALLNEEKLSCRKLPLFSNIDFVATPNIDPIYQLINEGSDLSPLTPENRGRLKVLVFFGSLHSEWSPHQMMEKLSGADLLFLSIGRLGLVGERVWANFSASYSARANFIKLGDLPAEQISAALQFSDIGVAASPWNLIEKSGSVLAMLEHGLPVLVTRNDFLSERNFIPDDSWSQQLHPLWKDDFRVEPLRKVAPSSRLTEVAQQLLGDLQHSLSSR